MENEEIPMWPEYSSNHTKGIAYNFSTRHMREGSDDIWIMKESISAVADTEVESLQAEIRFLQEAISNIYFSEGKFKNAPRKY